MFNQTETDFINMQFSMWNAKACTFDHFFHSIVAFTTNLHFGGFFHLQYMYICILMYLGQSHTNSKVHFKILELDTFQRNDVNQTPISENSAQKMCHLANIFQPVEHVKTRIFLFHQFQNCFLLVEHSNEHMSIFPNQLQGWKLSSWPTLPKCAI